MDELQRLRLRRLGEFLRERRGSLSQEYVAKRGGPSTTMQSQLEHGKVESRPQDGTFRKIDAALGWQAGSAKAFFDRAAEPTLIREPKPEPPSNPLREASNIELLAEIARRLETREEGDHHDETPTNRAEVSSAPEQYDGRVTRSRSAHHPHAESTSPPPTPAQPDQDRPE